MTCQECGNPARKLFRIITGQWPNEDRLWCAECVERIGLTRPPATEQFFSLDEAKRCYVRYFTFFTKIEQARQDLLKP